ncbi:PREDICTED: solute carrier family 15 member 4-like [Amphimedon queenslandica]|uniref:Uncharacterized protein n=1 Tax=Amphimedon queenslandica TaxID=400682 RepID=A0A1X7UP87_AMPQE|nr:PREDICTED: solute carrier family 15 member 4-like [Amphimedon queenslandica]|eukprot:XP_011404482.1 PREDICTED: solute carrier family 15 member 4-like [Amphimedon queenslandica]
MDSFSLNDESSSSEICDSEDRIDRKSVSSYRKELKSRSLNMPSILLLIYNLPVAFCFVLVSNIGYDFTSYFDDSPCTHVPDDDDQIYFSIGDLITRGLFFLIPFCGWLSDTKIGRGNAIYLSLWLGWIGTLLQSIGCCLQYNSCGTITYMIGRFVFPGLALALLYVSLAFLLTTLIAYGIDQMINDSSVKIRAFIHWLFWEYFFLDNVAIFLLNTEQKESGALTIPVVAFALFSFSLCLHFLLKHHFEHIPIPNPYRIVFKVIKFSLQNNGRQQRSAFTYWGEEPSRMDLAKERYGGSFTHEEVENVKTFFRILAIMLATMPFFIVAELLVKDFSRIIVLYDNGHEGLQENEDAVIRFISYGIPLVLIPLFELVIIPLIPKIEYFLINPLKGFGLSNILVIFSLLTFFIINVSAQKSFDAPCIKWEPGDPAIEVSYWILLIPSVLAGMSDVLSHICVFEFLCSQAPFGMHGMIIGLFLFLIGISFDIGLTIFLAFQYIFLLTSCTLWFAIIFCVIALFGLVVYVLVARWYVKRVRDIDLGLRTVIEEHWEQKVNRKSSSVNYNDDSSNYIISSIDV